MDDQLELEEQALDVMARISELSDGGWEAEAVGWLLEQPAGVRVTADDLVAACGLPRMSGASSNNCVGAFLRRAARDCLIRRVGYVKSQRSGNHGRVVALWEVS